MTASARYLYCVLPAYDAAPAVCAPALDGEPVHSIRHRDIAVLAHACAPEPYQGSETEVCNWIAAHNAVIEEAWKSAGTVLPMSFDVIVRGDSGRSAEANVVGWIEEHHAALRRRLQALRGRVEVGVQILRDAENLSRGRGRGGGISPGAPARARLFCPSSAAPRTAREVRTGSGSSFLPPRRNACCAGRRCARKQAAAGARENDGAQPLLAYRPGRRAAGR